MFSKPDTKNYKLKKTPQTSILHFSIKRVCHRLRKREEDEEQEEAIQPHL